MDNGKIKSKGVEFRVQPANLKQGTLELVQLGITEPSAVVPDAGVTLNIRSNPGHCRPMSTLASGATALGSVTFLVGHDG